MKSIREFLTLKLPIGQRIYLTFIMLGIAFCGGMVGHLYTYYDLTGTFPNTYVEATSIPLPNIEEIPTSAEVLSFVEADDTNLNEYDIGFNCVEYVFLMARNARWEGIPAVVTRIDFVVGSPHLILAFPTEERIMYIDPQLNIEVYPRIGESLGGCKVTGIYFMDINWIPLKEIVE